MTPTTDPSTRRPSTRAGDRATVLLIGRATDADRLHGPIARWTGGHVSTAPDLGTALRAITAATPQAVVSTLPSTEEQGLTLLMWMAIRHPEVPVVVVAHDPVDDEQVRWFGARAVIASSQDVEALAADVADAIGLSPAVDVWDHIAAVAGRRRPALAAAPAGLAFDADRRLGGLFRGLGQVRGLRGTIALTADGTLIGISDPSASLDATATVATLQVLLEESHTACTGVGLADLETAVFRTDRETLVVSCCTDADTHIHVVTIVAKDGNRALVELAHRRLRRDVQGEARTADDGRATA